MEKIIDEASRYGCQVLYVMGFEAPAQEEREPGRSKNSPESLDVAQPIMPGKITLLLR